MVNRRKPILYLLFLVALFSLPLAGQNFTGTWEGKFRERVFCVLKLEAGSKLSGTFSPGKVTVNDDGDIIDADPSVPDGSGDGFPILNPKVAGAKLSFDWKEGDADDEAMHFEMKLIDDGEAELRFAGAGAPPIKPIRLKRR